MSEFTQINRTHWDSVASSYSAYNTKVVDRMGREIVSRLDWIGARFLDPDAGDEGDEAVAGAEKKAVAADVDRAEADRDRGGGTPEKKPEVKLLDYACGPGMVSRIFAPYISSARGIDLSAAMAAEYNMLASNQGLTPSEMRASVGNLLDAADSSPVAFRDKEWFGFNIAAVGFGFHHFEDPVLAASRLAERLETGGVLLIIDFLPHAPFEARPDGDAERSAGHGHHGHGHCHGSGFTHSHEHGHGHGRDHGTAAAGHSEVDGESAVPETVKHLGFSRDTIRSVFEAAGVGKDFSYQEVAKGVVFATKERSMTRNIFFARGTKV